MRLIFRLDQKATRQDEKIEVEKTLTKKSSEHQLRRKITQRTPVGSVWVLPGELLRILWGVLWGVLRRVLRGVLWGVLWRVLWGILGGSVGLRLPVPRGRFTLPGENPLRLEENK